MTHEQRIAEIRTDLEMAIEVLSYGLLSNIPMERTVLALKNFNTLAAECLRLREDKERLDGAAKHIGNIDLYVKPVAGMMISQPMICDGESLRECLDKISQALDAAKEGK